MYKTSIEFTKKIRKAKPILVIAFINESGLRVFSDYLISDDMIGFANVVIADGSYLADGSQTAGVGSESVLDRRAIVLDFGTIVETLTPQFEDLLGSMERSQVGTINIAMLNKDNMWAKIQATENILNATIEERIYIPQEPGSYLSRFKGKIQSYELTREEMQVEARAI